MIKKSAAFIDERANKTAASAALQTLSATLQHASATLQKPSATLQHASAALQKASARLQKPSARLQKAIARLQNLICFLLKDSKRSKRPRFSKAKRQNFIKHLMIEMAWGETE